MSCGVHQRLIWEGPLTENMANNFKTNNRVTNLKANNQKPVEQQSPFSNAFKILDVFDFS